MSTNKLQKKADKLSEYTVFGYIRIEQQNKSKNNHIPKAIIILILRFYYDPSDEFDPKLIDKTITLSNNNKKIYRATPSGYCTSYGKRIIPSTSNGIYIWKIKNFGPRNDIRFGIDNADAKYVNKMFYNRKTKGVYAYSPYGDTYSWNQNDKRGSSTFYKGDIITLKLKLLSNISEFSIKINDTDEYIAFTDILREESLNYRLAIQFGNKDLCMEILD